MYQPAGFWIRSLAIIIDIIIFSIFRVLLGFILTFVGVTRVPTPEQERLLQDLAARGADGTEILGAALRISYDTGAHITAGTFMFSTLLITVLFLMFKGGTPGKLALGLRVRQIASGKNPSLWEAFLREVVGKGFLWPLTLGIGAWIMVFNKKKRGLHDFVAGSEVVKLNDE